MVGVEEKISAGDVITQAQRRITIPARISTFFNMENPFAAESYC
jgi:hypothetical protein